MLTSPLALFSALALVAVLALLLLRKVRRRDRGGLTMDFRKAKELERRKNRDLSAFP